MMGKVGTKCPSENESQEQGPCGCPAEAPARGHSNPSHFAPEGFCQPVGAGRSISSAVPHHNISFCLHPTPEHGLQMERTNQSISAREGEEVALPCRLQGAHLPGTQLSATWFQVKSSGRDRALLTLRYDGTMEYPQELLARRLYLRRPSAGDFSLTLSSVERGDAGAYYCQLQQWQQQSEGKDWALRASARSGYTQLTTIPTGNSAGCQGLLALHGSSPHSHAGWGQNPKCFGGNILGVNFVASLSPLRSLKAAPVLFGVSWVCMVGAKVGLDSACRSLNK